MAYLKKEQKMQVTGQCPSPPLWETPPRTWGASNDFSLKSVDRNLQGRQWKEQDFWVKEGFRGSSGHVGDLESPGPQVSSKMG